MRADEPFFTIVVAVYNGAATIQRCLDSVRNQTCLDRELIVIDGGSADGTTSILERSGDVVTYWHSEPDKGIYDAWNKALQKATGQWILFLGADDFLLSSETLTNVALQLRTAYPPFRLAYGQIAQLDQAGNRVGIVGKPWEKTTSSKKGCMPIPHQATFHHRTLFDQYGLFDISFRICGDHDFVLSELLVNDPLHIDIVVAAMGLGGLSTNPNHAWTSLRERFRIRRKHGLTLLTPLLLRHAFGEALFSVISAVVSKRASTSLRRMYKRMLGRPV
jgi:hypothetical protein